MYLTLQTETLSMKLTRPQLRTPYVTRAPMLDRLESGLYRRLTLVSAPAGFGKTHLIVQWITRLAHPVGWITLDEGDNDPVRFMRYLITACQSLDPAIGSDALSALGAPQQHAFSAVFKLFLNDLTRLTGRNILVLEDYHTITSVMIHELMTLVLDHLPQALHLVIITRTDPPFPLARLRAHDELNELRSADLQFTHEEVEIFIKQSSTVPLSESFTEKITQRTEGWIVGIRLIMLTLQEHHPADYERLLNNFSGSHRHVLEYLWSEVFAALPEPLQTFLLQTAFLNRLTAPLCNAVTQRSDSQMLLHMLEASNVFVFPLDSTQTWYRLHSLAAEATQQFARQRLSSAEIHELHYRASLWYEANGLLSEAVESSLLSREFAHAADLIEAIIEPQLVKRNHEYHTLRRWIEQLPDDVLADHPTLCLTYAIAILFTSDRHSPFTASALQRPLRMAENAWAVEGNASSLGELLAFRALVEYWQGDFAQMSETSRQALEMLPESQAEWRAVALLNLAMAAWLGGDCNAARQLIQQSEQLNRTVGNDYLKRSSITLRAEVCLTQGNLYEAHQLFQQLRSVSAHNPRDQARAIVGLCKVAFERHELSTLETDLNTALSIAEKEGDKHVLVDAAVLTARWKHAQGETDAARDVLQTLASRVEMPVHIRELRAWTAWLALMTGDIGAATGWHSTYAQSNEELSVLREEQEALMTARLLLAQNNIDAALSLLEKWQDQAHTQERLRSELEILILKTLAFSADRRVHQAREALLEALTIAHRSNHIQVFTQEGEAIAAILMGLSVGDNLELAAFIHVLLRTIGEATTRNQVTDRIEVLSAADALSPQEQRVFLLIAEGHSNPDIADALGVSINTIKTQVKSIYSKLHVSTRRQAREMARVLNLL